MLFCQRRGFGQDVDSSLGLFPAEYAQITCPLGNQLVPPSPCLKLCGLSTGDLVAVESGKGWRNFNMNIRGLVHIYHDHTRTRTRRAAGGLDSLVNGNHTSRDVGSHLPCFFVPSRKHQKHRRHQRHGYIEEHARGYYLCGW